MSIRPIRLVHAKNQIYKYVSVTADESKMMVRVLTPVPKDAGNPEVSSSDILTTNPIRNRYIDLNGQLYYVNAEGCFDKNSRIGKKWWKPCANIQFIVNPLLVNQGIVEVISKRDCCAHSYERSTEWISRIGYQGIAQIYCRSVNDSVPEAAKSFAVDEEGQCFTNFDLSNIVEMSCEELHKNKDASKFLVLSFKLNLPEKIEPNKEYECSFEIYKDLGQSLEKDTDDNWFEIKSLAGYIPQRKIYVKDGIGKFKFKSLDLVPGDKVDIQLLDQTGYICTQETIEVVNEYSNKE